MPYYKVILCDGDTETPLSMDNAPDPRAPQKGESWPVWMDGKQVYYEVVELGETKLLPYRELRVKRT